MNYNFAFAGGGPSGLSLAAQTYNGWFIGSGFEYAFTWLPINGLFLKTEFRLFAVRWQWRKRAADRRRGRHPGDGSGAKLPEGDGVHLDRTGLSLQLVWALIGLKGLRSRARGESPGRFFTDTARPPAAALIQARSTLGHVLLAIGDTFQQAGELPPGEFGAIFGRQMLFDGARA